MEFVRGNRGDPDHAGRGQGSAAVPVARQGTGRAVPRQFRSVPDTSHRPGADREGRRDGAHCLPAGAPGGLGGPETAGARSSTDALREAAYRAATPSSAASSGVAKTFPTTSVAAQSGNTSSPGRRASVSPATNCAVQAIRWLAVPRASSHSRVVMAAPITRLVAGNLVRTATARCTWGWRIDQMRHWAGISGALKWCAAPTDARPSARRTAT